MNTMNLTPAEILAARWNATYLPGTPVTVTPKEGSNPSKAFTAGEAFTQGEEPLVPVTSHQSPVTVPLSTVEHRIVLSSEATRASLALGMPPIEELGDPEPLLDLHSQPRGEPGELYADRWLTIPHAIAGYIAKLPADPTHDQREHIERHIAEYHGLPPVCHHHGTPWLRRCDASGLTLEQMISVLASECRITGNLSDYDPSSPYYLADVRGLYEANIVHGKHPKHGCTFYEHRPAERAAWSVQFTFAHRFITGTAQLCRNH
jgi:hypothetical protein